MRAIRIALLVAIVFPTMGVLAMPVEAARTPRCTITGTPGPDLLLGTPRRDVICGLEGDDTLVGLGGNDLLLGGPGDDALYGGAGPDAARGKTPRQDGADTLRGGEGDDEIGGGTGNDLLDGGPGDDWLAGEPGNDSLSGGPGDDALDGGPGSDTFDGGEGHNHCTDPAPVPGDAGCGDGGDAPGNGGGGDGPVDRPTDDTPDDGSGDGSNPGDPGSDRPSDDDPADRPETDPSDGNPVPCTDPTATPTDNGCLEYRVEPGATATFPAIAAAGDVVTFGFQLPVDAPDIVMLWIHDGSRFVPGCSGQMTPAAAPPASGGRAWERTCSLPSPAPDRTMAVIINTIREFGVSRYAEYGSFNVIGTSTDAAPPSIAPAGARVDGSTLTLSVEASDPSGLAFLWLLVRYPAEQGYAEWPGCQVFLDVTLPTTPASFSCPIPAGAARPGAYSVMVWAGDPLDNRVTELWTLQLDATGGATLSR